MFLDARAAFKVTRNLNTSLCLHGSVLWRGYMAWNSYLCKQQMQANEKRIITMNRSQVFIYLLQTYFCFHTKSPPSSCIVLCSTSTSAYCLFFGCLKFNRLFNNKEFGPLQQATSCSEYLCIVLLLQ